MDFQWVFHSLTNYSDSEEVSLENSLSVSFILLGLSELSNKYFHPVARTLFSRVKTL